MNTTTLTPEQQTVYHARNQLEDVILDIEMFAQVGLGEADQGTPAWAHLLHKMSERLREQFNHLCKTDPLRKLQTPTTEEPQT